MKVDPVCPDKNAILAAVKTLKRGGLIIFPTETVYGMGADPKNRKAVKKMFAAKKRPTSKPFQLLISDIKQAKRAAKKIPKNAAKLMRDLWPGPLTLVVKKKRSVPDFLTAGLPTVGLRMPDHPVALAVIKAFKGPIAATSANISGKKAPKTAKQAVKDLKNHVEIILDSGQTKIGIASKVLDISGSRVRTLRK